FDFQGIANDQVRADRTVRSEHCNSAGHSVNSRGQEPSCGSRGNGAVDFVLALTVEFSGLNRFAWRTHLSPAARIRPAESETAGRRPYFTQGLDRLKASRRYKEMIAICLPNVGQVSRNGQPSEQVWGETSPDSGDLATTTAEERNRASSFAVATYQPRPILESLCVVPLRTADVHD